MDDTASRSRRASRATTATSVHDHRRRRERSDADHAAPPRARHRAAAPRHLQRRRRGGASPAFRDAGGLVWIAHTEQHDDRRSCARSQPDGIEVYNLHANIDPNIRSMYLGLDPAGAIAGRRAVRRHEPRPSRAGSRAARRSSTPNQPAIDRWNQLLADGRHVPATAGSDAHENALPVMLADGERGDSYRRVLRWFGNIVLVADPQDPAQIEAALAAGRLFAVFEMMGTPEGFDVHARRRARPSSATRSRVGATLEVARPARAQPRPVPSGARRSLPRLIRIDATGPDDGRDRQQATSSVPMSAHPARIASRSRWCRTTSARTSRDLGTAAARADAAVDLRLPDLRAVS